jgi:hypothetical protein
MPLHVQRNQRILELPACNTLDGFRGMAEGGTMAASALRGGAAPFNDGAASQQHISQQDRDMIIRDATEADVPEIQSIYAHHVLTGTGTF